MFETIFALATAPLKSALAIIRISGDNSFSIINKMVKKPIKKDKGISINTIFFNEKEIDQVVINKYVSPNSFTGEDSLEIICHGSMLIVKEIISILIILGAREARNGEFSERAFLNKKIDLVQAEAINDMINASTSEGKDLALLSLNGKTSLELLPLIDKVGYLLSLIEVNIDYPEYEDLEEINKDKIINLINEMIPHIEALLESAKKGYVIVNGINVAIVGRPNVGKSSLLNALLGKEKAIVTDIAGTTRDIVEGDINIDGLSLHLIDTAGIRESDNVIESIGIKKAKENITSADLVLVLLDSSNITKEDEELIKLVHDKKNIIVYNKKDLVNIKDTNNIYISAKNNDIKPLINKIKEIFGIDNFDISKPSLTSAREIGLLSSAKENLILAKENAIKDLPIDIISSSIMSAFKDLKGIIGEDNSIDISKEIFSRFCVGK